jgi:hypothetical protein
MTPPSTTWGKRYVTVEYSRENRNGQGKGDVFRVVAREPNTRWTLKYYDKTSKALLGQGGGVLTKAGEFADLTQAGAPTTITHGYSVWEADKPIFVMQYSCSSTWDGDPILDPFMINVTPEEQFLTSTLFQTPVNAKFQKHRVNLIVKCDVKDPDYIKNLESLEIDGIPVWRHPAAISPTLKFNHMGGNLHWTTLDYGTESRAHRISGNGKVSFGGYIYGYGAVDAYGWPAAAGFRPTGYIDTMPPVIKGDSLCGDYTFEATEIRNIPDPPVIPPTKDSAQIESGIAVIDTVEGGGSFNYRLVLVTDDNFPSDLAASYKKFSYRWEVIDKSKDAYCVYFVQDWWGNVTRDTCWYFADKLTIAPNPLNFGKIRLGTKARADVTITNNSDAEVTLTQTRLALGTHYAIVAGGIVPPNSIKVAAKASHVVTVEYDGREETTDIRTDFDFDTLVINTACGEFKDTIKGVAAVPRITVTDFDAGTTSLNNKVCKTGGIRITNPGSDTLVITSITGYLGTKFTVTPAPALPIVIPPKGTFDLKEVCYESSVISQDSIDVVFGNNGEGPDSVSTWKGSTQEPGPVIIGYDWLERRVNTLHVAYASVSNTGNQEATLQSVTFQGGGQYFPAGATEANYVFKIVGLFRNGQPVTDPKLKDGAGVDVMVMFRPDAVAPFTATIVPVWAETMPAREAKLLGVGILPQIATQPISYDCNETPYLTPVNKDITITNNGTMDLTVSGAQFQGGAQPGYAIVSTNPPLPMTVARNGGTATVTISYTRPNNFTGGSAAVLELIHDATPGTGVDSITLPQPLPRENVNITVGSCNGPDIAVTDIPFGRQRANCDAPIVEFFVENTGGGPIPLEVRGFTKLGADTAAFQIVGYLDNNGQPTGLPLIIQAGAANRYRVRVQFTPTEPNAAPWADRLYNAQFEAIGYPQGDNNPVGPAVTANVTGTGYVLPVTMNLTNDMQPGATREPGQDVQFTVTATSPDWLNANVTSFTADVIYDTENLIYRDGSVAAGAVTAGWTISEPVVTQIDPTRSQMRFNASGPARVSGDGVVFQFRAALLLSQRFTSAQNLVVTMPQACVITTTTGDSTTINNCAITRRVIALGDATQSISQVSPNPVSGGSATVTFGVGIPSVTSIDLVNSQGQVVRSFINERLADGEYDMTFSTQGLASGVYILRYQTGAFSATRQLVIVD